MTDEERDAIEILKAASRIMRPKPGAPVDGDSMYANLIADALVAEVVHRVGRWPNTTGTSRGIIRGARQDRGHCLNHD